MAHSDIDSAFEDITLFENSSQQKGYSEGYSKGCEVGFIEGYSLGCEHGTKLGSEIGFYKGFAEMWKSIIQKKANPKRRILSTLDAIITLIKDFPVANPQDEHIQDIMLNLRAKFKQACSLLNISSPSNNSKSEVIF